MELNTNKEANQMGATLNFQNTARNFQPQGNYTNNGLTDQQYSQMLQNQYMSAGNNAVQNGNMN